MANWNRIPIGSICYKCERKAERREIYNKGKWTGKYLCETCYERQDPNSRNNIVKSLANRRTGNLKNPRLIFADNCEELTCLIFGVNNLNKINNNYSVGTPIDHDRHHNFGILQTKGSNFSKYIGAKGGWAFKYRMTEFEKEYDNMICWCLSKNGDFIERIYIIPKTEINKRLSIAIVKDPITWPSWYEKYRITNEEELGKVNEIWQKIISEESI